MRLQINLANLPINLFTGASYTGDGYSGIYIWGAQLEAGAFPTSYIKTEGSQVTRSADSASITGSNFSGFYNQAEGTIYADWSGVGSLRDNTVAFAISDGGFNNSISLIQAVAAISNSGQFAVITNGSGQASLNVTPAYVSYQQRKFAGSIKTNDIAGYANGQSSGTDTSAYLPLVNRLNLGASWSGTVGGITYFKKVSYYPKALTATQLQALTS